MGIIPYHKLILSHIFWCFNRNQADLLWQAAKSDTCWQKPYPESTYRVPGFRSLPCTVQSLLTIAGRLATCFFTLATEKHQSQNFISIRQKTHFQLSHKLKCNRHQFFHAVHHITRVQDFHIHREFFLTKVHEMPKVDGQVLLFRQLQNEGCAVVTAS